jgi:hypothetical protein
MLNRIALLLVLICLILGVSPAKADIILVSSPGALPADGYVDWSTLGPEYTSVASGTSVAVSALPGFTIPSFSMTFSNANGAPFQLLTEGSGWSGNFAPGTPVLWTGGYYDGGQWTGNGPVEITFSSPQRGLGFQIMADGAGPFEATMCLYDAADALLGCGTFPGTGNTNEDGSAAFVGIYTNDQIVSHVLIDVTGSHDFAISSPLVVDAPQGEDTVSVPEPGTLTLLGSMGLFGLVTSVLKKKKPADLAM